MLPKGSFLVLLSLLLLSTSGFASSSNISDSILDSHGSMGRSLLQAKKDCPVDLEFLNYTILTSQCKGPQYRPALCCKALKELACPYADELNDETSVCASTMFSYIQLYGKYPPGLFANLCKEDKVKGLKCDALSPDARNVDASEGHMMAKTLPVHLMLETCFLFIFFLIHVV